MGDIYIASKEVTISGNIFEHLYLVYDANGDFDPNDPGTSLEDQIIRGGPNSSLFSFGGLSAIRIEAGQSILESEDILGSADPLLDREYTLLASNADATWNTMVSFAEGLGTQDPNEPAIYITSEDVGYYATYQNSNSVINSVLLNSGFDLRQSMPYIDGNTNNSRISPWLFPGHDGVIGDLNANGNFLQGVMHTTTDFADSFIALGYDAVNTVDDFLNNGWSVFGSGNAGYDDYTYDLGGIDYTVFGHDQTINMSTIPNANDPLWSTSPIGGFSINPYISNWNNTLMTYQNFVSPLTFDLDGDGIESNHIYSQNVHFDIDGDGYAEKVGWIDADDGQLAFDANGDGIINDITELFGDDIMPAFQKLALFDTNGNGMIDQGDADYANLLVWQDLDQDGFSDSGELQTLIQVGIKEISLAETPEETYQNENYISGRSTYTRFDNTTGDIADVHFLNDNVNTWFQGAQSQVYGSTYAVNPEALLLPLSRGYGSLASLHIAMTDNVALRNIMKELVNLTSEDFDQLSSKMEAFLYEWAGVTNNNPEARKTGNGSNIDARKVDFMEAFTGVEWQQMGVTELVGSKASLGVKKIWAEIENLITVRVLVQGTLHNEVFENATYDFVTDELTLGDDMATIIGRAQTYINGASADIEHQFWLSMGNVLIMHAGELGQTVQQISDALDTAYGSDLFIGEQVITAADGDIYSAIDGSDETLTTNTLVGTNGDDVITGSHANDYMFGLDGADTMYGLGGDDFLRGDGGGDLHLDGGEGDDRVEGDDGDDTLIGGDGRDDLRGGDGADILNGGDGQDKLHGGAGADMIDGGLGADEVDYLESDTAVYVNLQTRVADGGHATGDTFINVENITGSDFSDVLIGDGQANNLVGEAGNDFLYGGDGDDDLFGAHGNDQMFGEAGNDLFDGFDGAELMDGGTGTDTVAYTHPYNTTGVHADLGTGKGYTGAAAGDTYVSIENLIGSEDNDILVGDNGDNQIEGRGGNDILIGGDGNDTLIGGEGVNALVGGAGDDRFIITPHDVGVVIIHDFNPAEDVLDYQFFTTDVTIATAIDVAAIGADTLIGIDGANLVLLKGVQPAQIAFSNLAVSTANNTLASINVYTNVDTGIAMQGDQYGNKLFGTLHDDTIDGQDGDDEIFGGEGDDDLSGGNGADTFQGGYGADDLDGGADVDLADYRDSHEGVTIDLINGTGLGGTAEGDTLTSIEVVQGSVFDDTIIGSNESNILHGDVGNDVLHAKGGQKNTLYGGLGNDTFVVDQVTGPTLADTGLSVIDNNFIAVGGTPTSITYIPDFEAGKTQEKIDLSNMTLTDIYVRRVDDVFVNGETVSGTVLQLFNGTDNQTVLLKDARYEDFSVDHFVLPTGISVADIHWQVISGSNGDVLLGSGYNDELFGLGGNDFFLGGQGDNTVYSNFNDFDYFHISKNAGSTETIYSFQEYYRAVQWFPGGPSGTITIGGENATNLVPALSGAVSNGIMDLSNFADIRDFGDISISLSGNDTVIDLTDQQQILLKDFAEGLYLGPNNENGLGLTGNFNDPEYGIVGYGTLYDTLKTELDASNFIFYDGTLNGDEIIGSVDDILEGGYGVDHIFGHTGDDVITGAGENDTLEGGSGQDTLDGEEGDDMLIGGDDGDTFIIDKEAGSTDTISDFEYWRPDEQIDLTAFDADFTDFADLSLSITQQGNDTHIDLGGNQTLILSNFTSSNLTASNVIGVAGGNTAPTAVDDALSGTEDQAIAGNLLYDNGSGVDNDIDSDPLEVIGGTFFSNQGGTIVLNADGTFTYTPLDHFNGTDGFTYTLIDPYGGTDTALVSLNLAAVNDIPVAQDDAITIPEDTPLTLSVLSNDVDADNDVLSLLSVGTATNGTVVLNPDDTISYTPNSHFHGVDSFTYTISDGNGGQSTATVTVTVTAVNDVPVTQSDLVHADTDTTLVISASTLLGNDSDAENDPLVIASVVSGANGTAVLNGDGTVSFTPNTGFEGITTFTYAASDGYGGISAFETVTVTVNDIANDIMGTENVDTLSGTSAEDALYGLGGNDTINGGAGDDLLEGGDGDDFLDAGNGDDVLIGGAGDDTMQAWKGLDVLNGGEGNDTLYGHNDLDYLYGGDGADEMRGEGNDDFMYGGDGNDEMYGGHGNDEIHGELGDDTILGWSGSDLIYGGLGNDTIYGEDNNDTIHGGDGDDIIHGGNDADTLYGGDGSDTLIGGFGQDALYGEAGDDHLFGENQNDTFDGGLGSDTITTQGGNDRVEFYSASAFSGIDTITDLNTSFDQVDIRDVLSSYNAYTDDIRDFVRITNDGTNSTLAIDANGGADSFVDIAILEGITTMGHLDWSIAKQILVVDDLTVFGGDGGSNTITGSAYADRIYGLNGQDTLNGGGGHDLVYGGNNNDTLNGDAGNDVLWGNDGNDIITGGNGNDVLFGGNGADTLTSNAGNDTYLFTSATAFSGVDTLTGMNINADNIDISDILTGYDPLTDLITDFVEITDNGSGGSTLKVDADGTAGGVNFVQIATIDNIIGITDEAQLVANGTLWF